MAVRDWVFALAVLLAMAGVFAANRYARGRAWSMERRRLVTLLCLFGGMFLVMDGWLLFSANGVRILIVLFLALLLALQLGVIFLMTLVLNRISSAIERIVRD